MKKRILALIMAATMVFGLTACGGAAEEASSDKGGLIKVGIINNDPNESGYRTANDKDLKATFTKNEEINSITFSQNSSLSNVLSFLFLSVSSRERRLLA